MTIITSTQAGNWSSGSTWVGGVAPGDGDQAVISHAVTVDANTTVGASRPSTYQGVRPSVSATGSGGSLPAGNYTVKIAPVGSTGEATLSLLSFATAVSAGQLLRVVLPTVVGGATAWQIYLTEAGGSTFKRYATNKTGTFDCSSASWEDGTQTFADAPAPSHGDAIQIRAALTVAAGITLTAKGDVVIGNSTLTMEAGSTLTFDPDESDSGAAIYRLWFNSGESGMGTTTNTQLITNGTSGSRVTIQTKASSTKAHIDSYSGSTNGEGRLDCAYTNFTRLGSTTLEGLHSRRTGASLSTLDNCVFDECGPFRVTATTTAGIGVSATNCTWKNSAAFTMPGALGGFACVHILHSGTNAATETRAFTDCVFDRRVGIPQHGYVFTRCLFLDSFVNVSGTATQASEIIDCAIKTAVDSTPTTSVKNFTDTYVLFDDPDFTNPHFFNGSPSAGGQTWDGVIFEFNGPDGNGDCIKDLGAGIITIKNSLVLPNTEDESSGTLVTMFSTTHADCEASLYHNTVCNGTSCAVICEGGTQPVGTLLNVKSNLFWRKNSPPTPGAQGGYKVALSNGNYAGISDDILPPANATHNAIWNGRTLQTDETTPITKSYNYPHTTDPGDNDVDLGTGGTGPAFVDSSRNFLAWGESLGITGADDEEKTANIWAELALLNEAGYDSNFNIADLHTWVRAGFAPQNELLRSAGHDGEDIGAVAMESLFSVPPPPIIHSFARTRAASY